MSRALAAQSAARYDEAEALYREAAVLEPRSFDVLHMLGVTCLQLGRVEESCELLMEAMSLLTADHPPLFHNLALCVAALAAERGVYPRPVDGRASGGVERCVFRRDQLGALPSPPPRVSIVVPCYNHQRYVAAAIDSVSRQTYAEIELIVIDDGSTDGSAAVIARALAGCPYPHRFVQRENRGAHATLNEGIGLASGQCIGILNTDDIYLPERTDSMVRLLHAAGARWGFSRVECIDDDGRPIGPGGDPRADVIMRSQELLHRSRAVSESFAAHNYSISTGNLFFERSLWQEVGGFEALRYNHDWAFCLSALLVAEPAYLDLPLYRYRLHGSNTIAESRERAREEAAALLSNWAQRLWTADPPPNAVFASIMGDRETQVYALIAMGLGHLVERRHLLDCVTELGFGRTGTSPTSRSPEDARAAHACIRARGGPSRP